MKTQTLLLGDYSPSSYFFIYMVPIDPTTQTINDQSTTLIDYFSIEDLYRLFFHHSAKQVNMLFYDLYERYPHHFYRDQKNKCYVAKQHVLSAARSLHLFALAEFCTLTHDELVNRVADPLFATTNALLLRPVTPRRMDIYLDWFPLSSTVPSISSPSPSSSSPASASNSSSSSNSFFSSFLSSASRLLSSATNTKATAACSHHHHRHSHRHHHHHHRHHWQKNDHSWSHHFLPLPNVNMDLTLQAQKQQQAIIECRQRLSIYRQSVSPASKQDVSNTTTDQHHSYGGSKHLHQENHHQSHQQHQHQHQHQQDQRKYHHHRHHHHHHHQYHHQVSRKRERSPVSSQLPAPSPSPLASTQSNIKMEEDGQEEEKGYHMRYSVPSPPAPPAPPSLPPLLPNPHPYSYQHSILPAPHQPPAYQESSSSSSSTSSASSSSSPPPPALDHQQKRIKSCYSNLDLLATQATKMKGLPFSPEISPSSLHPLPPCSSSSSCPSLPPLLPISITNATTTATTTASNSARSSNSNGASFFIQSISLPSIRNVLSDI